MISFSTLAACLIALAVSLVLPVVLIVVFSRCNRGQKLPSAWFLGAAGFVVTQMLIRVPILTLLQSRPWFIAFSQNTPFLYAFLLAFTAGLFELAGRFAVAKCMSKRLTCKRSLAAGLGHGGIEAILLVGTTYLSNILFIIMINQGSFDSMAAEAGTDASVLLQLKDTLIQASPVLFLLGGYERVLAMAAHAAMSLIVCYGVHTGKPLKGALLCLSIHTLLDLTAGIAMLAGNVLSQGTAYAIIYTILSIAAALSVLIILKIRNRWPESEVTCHA